MIATAQPMASQRGCSRSLPAPAMPGTSGTRTATPIATAVAGRGRCHPQRYARGMPLGLTGQEWAFLLIAIGPAVGAVAVVYLMWRWARRSDAAEAARAAESDELR